MSNNSRAESRITSDRREDKCIRRRYQSLHESIYSVPDDHSTIRHSIYIIKEKLETLSGMESYLPTSDRHAASWIFSDGPSKQLGVVKRRYNALKLLFYNVAILRQCACFRQLLQTRSIALHTSWLINKDCLY